MIANTAPQTTASQPTVAFGYIFNMTEDELKCLHRAVKERLRTVHLLSTDNLNVVSVRLPFETCDQIRRLAFSRQQTISEVVRDAIDGYCKQKKG